MNAEAERKASRYVIGRCPVCYIYSPVCDQQEDIRRTIISEWWHAHFDKVHRFGPAFFRADPPAPSTVVGMSSAKGVVAVQLPCPACGQVIDLTAFDLEPVEHGGTILRCNRCSAYLNFSYSVTLTQPEPLDGPEDGT